MVGGFRLGATVLAACLLTATGAWGQSATVRRNSNLRPDPSMQQQPVRVLPAAEQVELPGSVLQNGYYKAKTTRGEEGWVWARNLRITSAGAGAVGKSAQLLQASNLRSGPSTRETGLGVLEGGTTLTLLEATPRDGFYRVKTSDGREGWVWGQNLALGTAPQAAAPIAAEPTAAPATREVAPPTPTRTERSKPTHSAAAPTATAAPAAPSATRAAAAPTATAQEVKAATATSAPATEPPQPTVARATATPQENAEAKLPASGALKPGDTLDRTNAALAKDLLPPEILGHFERGEYTAKIIDYPLGNPNWEKAFVDASKENADRLTVDERGTIIDKSTGKQAQYVYGIPFPNVDPNDPNAGIKIIWNFFAATWYGGSSHTRTKLVMLNTKGVERELGAEGWFEFYDAQAPKYRKDNPLNLQSQFLAVALSPADTQGTAALSWRYRDPDTHDSQWAFVPALRRVRAVSPANRSDGYLGSDICSDDGYLFDGKPQDFTFKVVGKRDALRVVDPEALPPNSLKPRPGRDGGWEALGDRKGYYGYEVPGWSGSPWALTSGGLAKRPMWIVEAVPRDKYYLYGKLILWIDAETYSGSYHQKFNWGGEHVLTYSTIALINQTTADGQETVPYTNQVWSVAENFKMHRASLAGARYDAKSPFDRRVKIDPAIFDAGALMRYGK